MLSGVDSHSHLRHIPFMYICICKNVNERQIDQMVQCGARHVRDLRAQSGLGTGCGKCVRPAREVLVEAMQRHCPQEVHNETLAEVGQWSPEKVSAA